MPAAAPSSNSYDEVPYESHPFSQTHPSRVASVAAVFGLDPPPVESCRVLELGCAAGGNIIPMAETFPGSWFVGVDYSARQIADGERIVRGSGMSNVSLRHASILDVDETYGRFDFIICHGVFSWVPDPVRDKILAICRELLAPSGVAYISYNTYPGWHMRGMIRDMMRYHATRFETPAQRIEQARALLDFLAQAARKDGSAYTTLLHSELEHLKHQPDPYLYHEHLEEVNKPLYFHEFIDLAARHDLRYLGEARLSTMVTGNFGPQVAKALEVVASDQIQAEQYLDFIRNRTFRETLLVHRAASPNWAINPEVLRRLHITTPRQIPDAAGDVTSTAAVQYETISGMTLSTSSPAIKAAMRILSRRWPATVAYTDLEGEVNGMLGVPQDAEKLLAMGLLNTFLSSDLLELHSAPIPSVLAGERPKAFAVARARVRCGERGIVTRRHNLYRTTELDRHLIPLLDGTRDRCELLNWLVDIALSGGLTVHREGQRLTDEAALRPGLAEALESALANLGKIGLLAG